MPGLGRGLGLGLSNNNNLAARKRRLKALSHELILPMQLLDVIADDPDGKVVKALVSPWQSIFEQLAANPDLLFEFSKSHRFFEEFIAGTYEKAGFDSVILTPASGDLGRDIIAEKRGVVTVRVIDQCKAFKKGNLVKANDVRAMMGTFLRETNASRAVVTTTSDFAPGVWSEWKDHIGKELELRNGAGLLDWMKSL